MIRGRMTSEMHILPFGAEHLGAAASLLAARQERLRSIRPELPSAFARAAACRPLVDAIFERPDAHGVVALRGDAVVGYLAGYPRPEPIWGRAAWSPIEGCALAGDLDAEHVRDLYAAWAQHFVLRGYFRQYIHAATDDPDLMAAWVRTGFGQMQAHAVRAADLEHDAPPGLHIRDALPADIDALAPLLPLIAQQLARPPAFAARMPEEVASYRESWVEELAEPGGNHLMIEEAGRPLAMASFYAAEPGPMVPDGAWELAVAMTLPEARGRGLMKALLAAGLVRARAAGARHCVTDWRTASLPTHRSWTALGFEPTHYRLHRHVDERIAWSPITD